MSDHSLSHSKGIVVDPQERQSKVGNDFGTGGLAALSSSE